MPETKQMAQLTRHLRIALIAILVLFAGFNSRNSWGQTDRGSISGTVLDPTGAAVGGVQVTIIDSVTKVQYSGSITNDRGVYEILNLPVGKYSLAYKRDGFKQVDRNGITVSAAQQVQVDVRLSVGAASETVTVTGDAAVMDTSTGTESTSVAGSAIEELPLSIAGGRNASAFAVMVVPSVNNGVGVAGYATSGVTVANSLTQSNNVMVDGIDADAGYQGGAAASAGFPCLAG